MPVNSINPVVTTNNGRIEGPISTLGQLVNNNGELRQLSPKDPVGQSLYQKIQQLGGQMTLMQKVDRLYKQTAESLLNEDGNLDAAKDINTLMAIKGFVDEHSVEINKAYDFRAKDPEAFHDTNVGEYSEIVELLTRNPAEYSVGLVDKYNEAKKTADADNELAITRQFAHLGHPQAINDYSDAATRQLKRELESGAATIFVDGRPLKNVPEGVDPIKKKKVFEGEYAKIAGPLEFAHGMTTVEVADFIFECTQASAGNITNQFLNQFSKKSAEGKIDVPFTVVAGGENRVSVDTKRRTVTTKIDTNTAMMGTNILPGRFKGTHVYFGEASKNQSHDIRNITLDECTVTLTDRETRQSRALNLLSQPVDLLSQPEILNGSHEL